MAGALASSCPQLSVLASPQPQMEGMTGAYSFRVSVRTQGPSLSHAAVKRVTEISTNPCS